MRLVFVVLLVTACLDQAAPTTTAQSSAPSAPQKSDETTGEIRGTAFDAAGNPIVGARVAANALETMTDDHGLYLLEVPPGTYDVVFEAPGLAPIHRSVEVKGGMVYIQRFDQQP